jgi:thiol:disulfide interchange protein DsbD
MIRSMTRRATTTSRLPLLLATLTLLLGVVPATLRAAPARAPVNATIEPSTLAHGQTGTLRIVVDVPEGLHAQSHTPTEANYIAFTVTMSPNPAVEFGKPSYPPGEVHDYGALGVLSVYVGKVTVTVPVAVKADAPPGPLKLAGRVQIQMCDDRMCYAPQRPKFEVEATITGAPSAAAPSTAPSTSPAAASVATAPPASQPSAAPAPASTGATVVTGGQKPWTIWTAFGAALIAGLLFNVMPCVLPVLPLKAVGFYEASQHHRARSFALGVVFSAGLISVFVILALVVLVFRFISWGELFTRAWFIWGIIVPLLTLMGIGLLGGWNLALPLGVYTFEPRHDTFGGNFFWGGLTAILATPCTAPLLPPLLIWASAQPAFVGVPAVVMVGVGMSLPYLLLSAMPELARRFPRTGPWSELFKQMMGWLILVAATYFAAGRLIHGPDFFWAVVFVVAIASLFLMARTVQLSKEARPVGIAAVLAVAMLAAPLWWTAKITGIASGTSAALPAGAGFVPFTDDAFKSARDAGKPVLVKFTANWCSTCQVIEGTVFRDPAVWQTLKDRGFEVMKVDFSTSEDIPGHDLLLQLNPAGGIPLTALFVPGRKEPVVLASVYNSRELLDAVNGATASTSSQAAAR